jgi:hypothetical protein
LMAARTRSLGFLNAGIRQSHHNSPGRFLDSGQAQHEHHGRLLTVGSPATLSTTRRPPAV